MAGRFQNQKGMTDLRRAEAVVNSQIKRAGKNAYPVLFICGCSGDCGWAGVKEIESCSINKPVLGYIPQAGVEIKCPVHGTHRVYGQYHRE